MINSGQRALAKPIVCADKDLYILLKLLKSRFFQNQPNFGNVNNFSVGKLSNFTSGTGGFFLVLAFK
jgi:hypothetical protein